MVVAAEMIGLSNLRRRFSGKDDPERVKRTIKHFHEANGVRKCKLISHWFLRLGLIT